MGNNTILRGAVTNNEPDVKETSISSGTFADAITASNGLPVTFYMKSFSSLSSQDLLAGRLIFTDKGIVLNGFLIALPNEEAIDLTGYARTSDLTETNNELAKVKRSTKVSPIKTVTILSRNSEETPNASAGIYKASSTYQSATDALLGVNESRPINGGSLQMIDLDVSEFAREIAGETTPNSFVWIIDRQTVCLLYEDFDNMYLIIPTQAASYGEIHGDIKEITEFPYTLTELEVTKLKTAIDNSYGTPLLYELPESPNQSSNMVEFDCSNFMLKKYFKGN